MKKTSFVERDKPLLCAMVQENTKTEAICMICNAISEGAEAIGIQLECLERQYLTEEDFKEIFSYCKGLPIYATAYRKDDLTDEKCAQILMSAARCGATLCDVMGDMFHPEPHELTFDETAIDKQKELIAALHAAGCEVLMSSHLHAFFPEQEVVRFARAQEERGADIVKIVNVSETEETALENICTCMNLKHLISKPYLYLANGKFCNLLRQIGGKLGCCMYLCVERYTKNSSKEQPLLRSMRMIRDLMVG